MRWLVIYVWTSTRAEFKELIQEFSLFWIDIAVMNGIVMKGRKIIIPTSLQERALDELCIHHMVLEEKLAGESVYWIKLMLILETPLKLLNTSWVSGLTTKRQTLYDVDCQSCEAKGLNADSLIKTCNIITAEYGLTKKKYVWCWHRFRFREILDRLQRPEYPLGCGIIIYSSELYASRGVNTRICQRLPEPSGIDVQQTNKGFNAKAKQTPILFNHDDDHYAELKEKQENIDKSKDTWKYFTFQTTGSPVTVQKEDSRPWTHSTIVGHGFKNHNGRSCKIRVTKLDVSSLEHSETWKTPPFGKISFRPHYMAIKNMWSWIHTK